MLCMQEIFNRLVLLFITNVMTYELTLRERKKYYEQVEFINQRNIGSLLIHLIDIQSDSIFNVIDNYINDLEQQYQQLQDQHIKIQTHNLKQLQKLQSQQYDIITTINQQIDGPQEKEKQFYEQHIEKLKITINSNYEKIDRKEIQLIKLQNELSKQIDDYDININSIDQILQLIESIKSDQTKIGLQFFQKRGKINTFMNQLQNTQINIVKIHYPMISQIIQLGIKNNFEQTKQYECELLNELRNKLVQDLNNLSLERIDQIEQEIQNIKIDTENLKQQVQDIILKLNYVGKDISKLETSKKRNQLEIDHMNNNIKERDIIFKQKEEYLMKELQSLQQIENWVRNPELIDFIRKKQ